MIRRNIHTEDCLLMYPVIIEQIEELKKTIRLMSFYKLNFLHLHLTDDQGWRIEIKKYPKLTDGGNIRKSTLLNRKGKTDSKGVWRWSVLYTR